MILMCFIKKLWISPYTNNEEVDSWIEAINMEGDSISIDRLEELLEIAPEKAIYTHDYYYMLGWRDMMYKYEQGL